jgi:hypothetical protein
MWSKLKSLGQKIQKKVKGIWREFSGAEETAKACVETARDAGVFSTGTILGASRWVAETFVPQPILHAVGAATQAAAGHAGHVAASLGFKTVSILAGKVVAASTLAVGATVTGIGLSIAVIGAAWLLNKAVKHVVKAIKSVDKAVKDYGLSDVGGAAPAAA